MSKKSFIDSVEVAKPCSENWEKMRGNDRVRFCDHCAKDVKNLSAITRKEAMRLVRDSGGGICIRYITHPVTKRPLFSNQLHQISRRVPGVAAGVMSASLSLATLSYAQSESTAPLPLRTATVSEKMLGKQAVSDTSGESKADAAVSNIISGSILDQNSAVIPNAKVTIVSIGAKVTAATSTNADGVYKFEKLAPGTYRIESEASGFKTSSTQVVVADGNEAKADVSMGIELTFTVDIVAENRVEFTSMGGAMVSVSYSTPLAKAVGNDDVDAVKELITKGENVNGKDEGYGNITPLFLAVENGNVEIATLLLNAGAKISPRDKEKQTPLMRLDEDATPELVELLVNYGSKIDAVDTHGDNALILAAKYAKPEVLQKLIESGADVNAANKEGQTALMNAAGNDEIEQVRTLLLAGANVNLKNKEGETAWDLATDAEIEKLLESYGAETKKKAEVPENPSVVKPRF